jgi:hypothetical protein
MGRRHPDIPEKEPSPWRPCWISSGNEPVTVGTGACYAVSRDCGDGLTRGLEEAVTNLLVRQRHVVVGKAYSPESLITEPMGGKAIAERIARFSREDVRERVLAQEILLSLDSLVKLEPELLRGFLTVRVGYLILLLTAEVAEEFSLIQDEAYEKLLGFSPSEVQSRLTTVLRDYAQVAQLLERQEALHLDPGIEVAGPQLRRGKACDLLLRPMVGWIIVAAEGLSDRCRQDFTRVSGKLCSTAADWLSAINWSDAIAWTALRFLRR